MTFKDPERKRAYGRERQVRLRAQATAEAKATNSTGYERQLGPDHDEPAIGKSLEQQRAWCAYVLSLPTLEELATTLAPWDAKWPAPPKR